MRKGVKRDLVMTKKEKKISREENIQLSPPWPKARSVCLGSEAFGKILTDLSPPRLSFLVWEMGMGLGAQRQRPEDVTVLCQTHKATRGHRKLLWILSPGLGAYLGDPGPWFRLGPS